MRHHCKYFIAIQSTSGLQISRHQAMKPFANRGMSFEQQSPNHKHTRQIAMLLSLPSAGRDKTMRKRVRVWQERSMRRCRALPRGALHRCADAAGAGRPSRRLRPSLQVWYPPARLDPPLRSSGSSARSEECRRPLLTPAPERQRHPARRRPAPRSRSRLASVSTPIDPAVPAPPFAIASLRARPRAQSYR